MKNKRIIKTKLSPKAIGPYSQAIFVDGFLFTSGQIPISTDSNDLVSENFDEQAIQTIKNLKNLLKSQNYYLNDIIKMTVFLTDLSDFDSLNNIFIDFFGTSNYPARSVVQVVKLPKGSKIEIEAICKK